MAAASQQLSLPALAKLISHSSSDSLSASRLVDSLSDFEAQICLLWTEAAISGDIELIRIFYASYLLALLLDDDV